ncbi:hypothetical protein GGS20DRAFT_547435 [Poronia punctata]|nr:hypothetical protein GGS20DRAFT_547435 [Poronia punctata]
MAPETFHLFPLLPFELREMIYLFTISPRIVRMKERHEDREAFLERVRKEPVQLRLHPSLSHFAYFWQDTTARWDADRSQRYLEEFGFTVSGPGPGPSSSSCSSSSKHQSRDSSPPPDLPHHALSENPAWAWEVARKGYLYSSAPIPPLLHATSESRHVLMRSSSSGGGGGGGGYELAFGTRTHGPRTWFNFDQDILFVGNSYRLDRLWRLGLGHSAAFMRFYYLLTGHSVWDIGQYVPEDMTRVRRLALAAHDAVRNPPLCDTIALFPNLRALYMEDCRRYPSRSFKLLRCRLDPDDEMEWWHTPINEETWQMLDRYLAQGKLIQ